MMASSRHSTAKLKSKTRRDRFGPTDSVARELRGHLVELGSAKATPPRLRDWVKSKSAADVLDGVYLVPAKGDKFYIYDMVTAEKAVESGLFLTLSARGVNEFHKSDVRFVSLDNWVREHERYETLLGIRLFSQFRLAKSFGTWRNVVRRQKFVKAARSLEESSCVLGNRHMRNCYVKLQSHLAKLSILGAADLQSKTTHVNDFSEHQVKNIERFADNFRAFRDFAVKLALVASKAAFAESGFCYDEYEGELAALRVKKDPLAAKSAMSAAGSMVSPQQPPKKLTFIEQANKRQCCVKITNFIRLVDFIVRGALHQGGFLALADERSDHGNAIILPTLAVPFLRYVYSYPYVCSTLMYTMYSTYSTRTKYTT